MQKTPTLESFSHNYSHGKTQLMWKWISSDLETPVSAYLKLCGEKPYCFLLESVEGGEKLGRYSLVGFNPSLIWTCKNNTVQIQNIPGETIIPDEPTIESLRNTLNHSKIDVVPDGLPPMAVSGLFGYLGYDMVRHIENLPDSNPDELDIPNSVLFRPQTLIIFDSVLKMACVVSPVYNHAGNSEIEANDAFNDALSNINNVTTNLAKPPSVKAKKSKLSSPLTPQSNMSAEEYKAAVQKVIDYTYEGDIFQGVPSQRFSVDFDLPSFTFYRALRRVNPSPFLFHLSFDGFQLAGASPEILVRVRDNEVTVRALAGTRKRGATAEEDQALKADLLADEKELAEHLMLIDLARNDVGKVSEYGTVRVTEKFKVEFYSHVMHIVSNVCGKLKSSLDIIDALFSGFPAGTLSGAPKIRAMEIIDEVEVARRSFYSGGIGYLSANGTLDTCIAIRTGLFKDGKLYVQSGAGVVADSIPESEHQECLNKAKAIIRAAELAIEESQDHA
ncbi:MAG: anthranilate synthase component I [Micavibrio sp.]|nr:anthranilate synthase component I [Micavibrio sp.]